MTDWAEYMRLLAAGVAPVTASTLVHEKMRRRLRNGGRPAMPREHGTERGWRQHRTDGTPACAGCRNGHAQHNSRTPVSA